MAKNEPPAGSGDLDKSLINHNATEHRTEGKEHPPRAQRYVERFKIQKSGGGRDDVATL